MFQNSLKDFFKIVSWKGIVVSYQDALSEEYTPLDMVYPVLTWAKGNPGHGI